MARVFEIFGKNQQEWRSSTEQQTLTDTCPHTGVRCDGGGNRHQTTIRAAEGETLPFLSGTSVTMVPGVCSIKTGDASPWIVCPRRLFAPSRRRIESALESYIVRRLSIERPYAIWPEVTYQFRTGGDRVTFRFDYVLGPVHSIGDSSEDRWQLSGAPTIIEVMTASTSGSNTSKGTDIASAFRSSLDGDFAEGPGINKRQVWARMASQLISKSQLAAAWGGRTVWMIQDNLATYVSQTTSLQFEDIRTDAFDDVSILSMDISHTDPAGNPQSMTLYSAPLPNISDDERMVIYRLFNAPSLPPLADFAAVLDERNMVLRR